jgi:lipoprotein-anchoring transpeptidase ErfK/SrfK
MLHPVKTCPRIAQAILALLLVGMTLLMSACGKESQAQQIAHWNQVRFDQQLKYAQRIGVPASLLQPLLQREQQLANSHPPFNLFSDVPAETYYHNLTTTYPLLVSQLQGLITSYTKQARSQTQQDLLDFQTTLQQSQKQHQPSGKFSAQLVQTQAAFSQAQYPKDYAKISSQIRDDIQALNMLADTNNQMPSLKQAIDQAKNLHLEVAPLMNSYQQDVHMLSNVVTLRAAQQLHSDVSGQYQQALAIVTVSIPYFLTTKLDTLQKQIQLLHAQAQDTTKYQQDIKRYKVMVSKYMSIADFQNLANHLDDDINQIQMTLLHLKGRKLLQQLDSKATAWGNAHLYHDSYNGQSYPLDVSYLTDGIESDLSDDLANATSVQDLMQVIKQANNALFNLHMMEADYNDKTPYDQVHATDLQLIKHYQLTGQIIIVSLAEQAMRLYQNGQLVHAFLVTTGRPERPSLPGLWSIQARLSPTIFKSSDPPGSPYWYPDTPIHYAMLYHAGGYFIHDAWWRDTYGPGTQFPHADASGDQAFAGNGSHGCINLPEEQAAWLYGHTNLNTTVVVY